MIKRLFIFSLVSILLSFESKADTLFWENDAITFAKVEGQDSRYIEISKGIFTVYQSGAEWFWLVPDSLLGRDFLLSTTLLKGSQVLNRNSQQRFGYAGDMFPARLISFVKQENAILLVEPAKITPIDDNVIFAKLNIVKQNQEGVLLNVTSLVENHRLFTLEPFKVLLSIGSYEADKSFVYEMKSFSNNVVIRSERSYRTATNTQSTRWGMGVSLLLLPKKPMERRLQDPRVGFFTQRVKKIGGEWFEQSSENAIKKWRLEPKDNERKLYASGQLVEPKKPILFYIDKDMPAYLIPHVKNAVEDWNIAFEEAGFKNAIRAKVEPLEENDDFSLDNAAHSYISYKASAQENAYGPLVCDPRSGEIICSHVALYHSLKNIVQNWYFAQCGIVDERARAWTLPDSLLGNLVKYVVSHEIGHALGLTHNFLGSAAFSVEEIRDKDFVKENGFGTSIMDYMRFNFAAQPQDGLANDDLIPRIGHYDRFAIEWGYRLFPNLLPEQQADFLKQWVGEKQQSRLYGFSNMLPPFAQEEDLSSDPIKANKIGMENLKKLMAIDTLWDQTVESKHALLIKHRYDAVFKQYTQFVAQATSFLGGTYRNEYDEAGGDATINSIDRARQRDAIKFLDEYFFRPQNWLIHDGLTDVNGLSGKEKMHRFYETQTSALIRTIKTISEQEQASDDPYKLEEYLADIRSALFGNELNNKYPVSEYRATLQQIYVSGLLNTIQTDRNLSKATLRPLFAHLASLTAALKKYEEVISDPLSKNHAAGLVYTINSQIS